MILANLSTFLELRKAISKQCFKSESGGFTLYLHRFPAICEEMSWNLRECQQKRPKRQVPNLRGGQETQIWDYTLLRPIVLTTNKHRSSIESKKKREEFSWYRLLRIKQSGQFPISSYRITL